MVLGKAGGTLLLVPFAVANPAAAGSYFKVCIYGGARDQLRLLDPVIRQ